MHFSIVIPVYNASKYLRQTLDSVLAQTYGSWEAVCVDDGSTDGSGAILDEYAHCDSRFVVIHQSNLGEGTARNTALKRISGKWFVFLDADDLLRDTTLEDVAKLEKNNPDCDLIGYGTRSFDEGKNFVWDDEKSDVLVCDCRTWLANRILRLGVWQLAYRRIKFSDVRFTELKIGADLVYVSECLAKTDRLVLFSKLCHGYRIYPESMSHRKRSVSLILDSIDFRRAVIQNLLKSGKGIDPKYVRIAGNQCLERAELFLDRKDEGDWGSVLAYWLESLSFLLNVSFLNRWQRFVARIVTFSRSRLLIRILCVWPYKLKKIGFHR